VVKRELWMNGKKAKLLRKVGKLTKRDKKLYNMLRHEEKEILAVLYQHIIEKNEHIPVK